MMAAVLAAPWPARRPCSGEHGRLDDRVMDGGQ
jgi:hypothetical protein